MFIQPYLYLARLNKPIGIFLLLIPCYWGLALASFGLPELKWILLFALGATIMRGAGCTINDIWDRSFDKQVKRTITRPLASGQLTTQQALLSFILQCFLGFFIFLQLPSSARVMSLIAFGLLLIYPLTKRWTYWPQLVLGLAFNSGLFVGWLVVVDLPLHVFLSLIFSFFAQIIGFFSLIVSFILLGAFIVIFFDFFGLYFTFVFSSKLMIMEFYKIQSNQLIENWHFIKVTYGFDITVPLFFYLAGICWTLAYDTIYAYPDKEDDQKIGVKSVPVKFQNDTSVIVLIFYLLFIVFSFYGGITAGLKMSYYVCLLLIITSAVCILSLFYWSKTSRYQQLFTANQLLGWFLLVGIFLGK